MKLCVVLLTLLAARVSCFVSPARPTQCTTKLFSSPKKFERAIECARTGQCGRTELRKLADELDKYQDEHDSKELLLIKDILLTQLKLEQLKEQYETDYYVFNIDESLPKATADADDVRKQNLGTVNLKPKKQHISSEIDIDDIEKQKLETVDPKLKINVVTREKSVASADADDIIGLGTVTPKPKVKYGTTREEQMVTADADDVKMHEVGTTNLNPKKKYATSEDDTSSRLEESLPAATVDADDVKLKNLGTVNPKPKKRYVTSEEDMPTLLGDYSDTIERPAPRGPYSHKNGLLF